MNSADLEQGTQQWRDARAGCVTASRICDVLRKPRRGQKESATRKAYLAQIALERMTGKPQEREFDSWDLRRGKELEPLARVEYEMKSEGVIQSVGFVEHSRIKFAGCSPDGLVGKDGLCQIKAPRAHVHMDYIMSGIVPIDYRPQMLFEMSVTGRKWNDFVSYNQDMPSHLQLFIFRLHRDDAEIAEIEQEVVGFLAEVEELIAKMPKAPDPLEINDDDIATITK